MPVNHLDVLNPQGSFKLVSHATYDENICPYPHEHIDLIGEHESSLPYEKLTDEEIADHVQTLLRLIDPTSKVVVRSFVDLEGVDSCFKFLCVTSNQDGMCLYTFRKPYQ